MDWKHRSERYTEKLATPDTSVADLVGDIDPSKVAEGRSLGDPETIAYGLIPRAHRGIVAASSGRTKIADSTASRLDCHDAGPKCAVGGRSRQSGEFTVPRVPGSCSRPNRGLRARPVVPLARSLHETPIDRSRM